MPVTQKKRCRTSVACGGCRSRRTKCIVTPGSSACQQCLQNGAECIFDDTDERKRPSSKAYVRKLTERVRMLEELLQQSRDSHSSEPISIWSPNGQSSQPDPEKESNRGHSTPAMGNHEAEMTEAPVTNASPTHHLAADFPSADTLSVNAKITSDSVLPQENMGPPSKGDNTSVVELPAPPKTLEEAAVSSFVATQPQIPHERESARPEYFGPSANYPEYPNPNRLGDLQPLNRRRAELQQFIDSMPAKVVEHLTNCFWTYYNTTIPHVSRSMWTADKEKGGNTYYTPLLHLCMLAIGYRYADRSIPSISDYAVSHYQTTMYLKAKSYIEAEITVESTLPLIQATLLMADLQGAAQRYHSGWMYVGIACRMCLALGLHRDIQDADFSTREMKLRHMVLWACVTLDRAWALFMGRPTVIRSSDLGSAEGPALCRTLVVDDSDSSAEEKLQFEIYEAFDSLMKHASKITDDADLQSTSIRTNAYFTVAKVYADLDQWYKDLPQHLKWTGKNVQSAPSSFFLLHQQLHFVIILLYRPLTLSDQSKTPAAMDQGGRADTVLELSRTICHDNAARIAQILSLHCRKFPSRKMFASTPQHIAAAALALLAQMKYTSSRDHIILRLHALLEVVEAQVEVYHESERAANLIFDALRGFKGNNGAGRRTPTRPWIGQAKVPETVVTAAGPSGRPWSNTPISKGVDPGWNLTTGWSSDDIGRGPMTTRGFFDTFQLPTLATLPTDFSAFTEQSSDDLLLDPTCSNAFQEPYNLQPESSLHWTW